MGTMSHLYTASNRCHRMKEYFESTERADAGCRGRAYQAVKFDTAKIEHAHQNGNKPQKTREMAINIRERSMHYVAVK